MPWAFSLSKHFFVVPVVFYGSVAYGMFRFIEIARRWPSLIQHWELVESKLPKWRTQYEKRQLAVQIKMVSFIVLLCSLGDKRDFFCYLPRFE